MKEMAVFAQWEKQRSERPDSYLIEWLISQNGAVSDSYSLYEFDSVKRIEFPRCQWTAFCLVRRTKDTGAFQKKKN